MYPQYCSKFPELGFYGLPGHSRAPRDVLAQVRDGEALGIGNVMISERADYKEIAAICGACAAVSESIYIGTSATNLNTRHPIVTASMCSTLNRLSEGRFALGLAKGVGIRWKLLNLDYPSYEKEREFLDIMRALLRGEPVSGFAGALGSYPHLQLADYVNEDVPLLYVGFGLKSLVNAGRIYDGVHLHTFIGQDALARAVDAVRQGEREAQREAGKVKVWSVLATVCDASEEAYLKRIVARCATYLQIPSYGEALVKVNGWDEAELARFRQSKAVQAVGGLIDSVATTSQLEAIEKELPESWRPAAVGDAKTCAHRWLEEFEAGADGIIIHASTPEEFAPVLREYEKIRPASRFAERVNRPA
ncbi:MAG: TIGR03857 family LLM class F420-dependent oxidoreductase [Gammaproteobacteria bacterium]|nr:TIGR03857 family LLM class F420-dependent oxidoreductase [Gammaproteobacteria bacterium]